MEAQDVYGLVRTDRVPHLQRMLAERGLRGTTVQVSPPAPGRYRLHDETLHLDASAARRGALLGTLLGAAVGLALAGMVATTLIGAAISGAGFGALVGAMVGLQRVESMDGDPVAYREVTQGEDVALVAVHHEHWHNRAHRILERHGAVFVEGPEPS